jgi:hypothetical protein
MGSPVVRTLYRELLRGSRRVHCSMRAGHVVLVSQCVNRFAQDAAPPLQHALASHGALPLDRLVGRAFRLAEAAPAEATALDQAFAALRAVAQIEAFIESNNRLYDSLEDLSDREAPNAPPVHATVSAILREARPTHLR